MPLKTETYEQQRQLAKYCRTASEPALLGITPGRLHHYRRLVFNVIVDALTSTYPLSSNLLGAPQWLTLCHDFFSQHKCADPQVWRMPQELITYLHETRHHLLSIYPFLLELIHFEWKEAEYYMMPDKPFDTKTTTDFWHSDWNLNPESEILPLTYPVHLKNAKQISEADKSGYHCLIFRQPDTFKVRFLNLSALLAHLLVEMKQKQLSPQRILSVKSSEFSVTDIEAIRPHIKTFFEKLRKDGMLR